MPELSRKERATLERLAWDTPFFAEHCMRIVDKGGVVFVDQPAQDASAGDPLSW